MSQNTHDFDFSRVLPHSSVLRVRHPRRTPHRLLQEQATGDTTTTKGSACEKVSSMRPSFAGGTATWSCCFALFYAAALIPGRAGSFQLVPSPFPRHAAECTARLAGFSACRVGRKCSAVQMVAGGSKGDHEISESGTKLNKGELKKPAVRLHQIMNSSS